MKENDYKKLFERYLLKQTSAEEEQILVDWVCSNPELLAHIQDQIEQMPNELEQDIVRTNLEAIYAAIKPPVAIRASHRLSKWGQVAALFILSLLSALAIYLYTQQNIATYQPLTISIAKGQKAQVSLPDGTLVWLNAHSSLTYDQSYNLQERRVKLVGEGFFEIQHNPSSPFRVELSEMTVEALGTSFVIKAYPLDATVYTVLHEGKVKVSTPSGDTFLSPNEKFEYDRVGKQYTKSQIYTSEDYSCWINNQLRFENASFEQIIRDLERIYAVDIQVQNKELLLRRFTGTIPNNGIHSILSTMQQSVEFRFRLNANLVIIE